jgi:hypothetical protein
MPSSVQDFYLEYIDYLSKSTNSSMAYVIKDTIVDEDLHIRPNSNFDTKSHSIGCFVSLGDLRINCDLINDSHIANPLFIVHGNLYVRNWLRGGMNAFVTGDINAQGYLVGAYEDAALIVGGSLNALGYLHRRKPFPDRPKFKPHQIFGSVNACEFDVNATHLTDKKLRETFVEDILIDSEDGLWYDEEKIMAYGTQSKSIWKN